MVQHANALVVSDAHPVCDTLAGFTSSMGLLTQVATSVEEAQRFLRERSPTLAVVEAGDVGERVLCELGRTHPATHTAITVNEPEGAIDLARCLLVAQPSAVVISGPTLAALTAQLRAYLDREVGDIRVERGSLVHGPSGERFRHEVGVRLLLAYPSAVQCRPQTREYMALYRLKQWLRRVGAAVTVLTDDGAASCYRLQVVDVARSTSAP